MSQRGRSRQQNHSAILLGREENERLFQIIGNRSVTLASAVVQVVIAPAPYNQWQKKCCGVATFVKDNQKRSYYIRVYDLKGARCVWEQEIYNQFKYKNPRPYFHTFDTDNSPAGLNFANEDEANRFKEAVQNKLQQRQQRRTQRRQKTDPPQRAAAPPMGGPQRPPHPSTTSPKSSAMPSTVGLPPTSMPSMAPMPADSGKDTLRKKNKDKNKKPSKGSKLTKGDIGTPTDFRHVGHVGWDPDKGFDMNNLDPALKTLFDEAQISEDQLKDKETAQFIYDFIDSHGGIEQIKSQGPIIPPMGNKKGAPMAAPMAAPPPPNRAPARTPAPPAPPSMSGPPPGMAPPPPPNRMPTGAPPPMPPSRGYNAGPPMPSMPPSNLQPPPPPPSRSPAPGGRGMAVPPPPPPGRSGPPPGPPPPAPPFHSPPSRPPMGGGGAMPPPPPAAVAPPPPPPPPPPPMGGGFPPPPPPAFGGAPVGAAPPPPPSGMGNNLLSEIHKGAHLKHVDASAEPAEASGGDEQGALLKAIRAGTNLKKVDPVTQERPESQLENTDGLAGALARALQTRANHIQDDDDEDEEDDEDDDDEWED